MTAKRGFTVELSIPTRTSTFSPATASWHASQMASLETRLSERIREDESLPPLGVSLTNVTYGADDRKAWRKQGKVIWEMAAEAAAVDDEF